MGVSYRALADVQAAVDTGGHSRSSLVWPLHAHASKERNLNQLVNDWSITLAVTHLPTGQCFEKKSQSLNCPFQYKPKNPVCVSCMRCGTCLRIMRVCRFVGMCGRVQSRLLLCTYNVFARLCVSVYNFCVYDILCVGIPTHTHTHTHIS